MTGMFGSPELTVEFGVKPVPLSVVISAWPRIPAAGDKPVTVGPVPPTTAAVMVKLTPFAVALVLLSVTARAPVGAVEAMTSDAVS